MHTRHRARLVSHRKVVAKDMLPSQIFPPLLSWNPGAQEQVKLGTWLIQFAPHDTPLTPQLQGLGTIVRHSLISERKSTDAIKGLKKL